MTMKFKMDFECSRCPQKIELSIPVSKYCFVDGEERESFYSERMVQKMGPEIFAASASDVDAVLEEVGWRDCWRGLLCRDCFRQF